MRKNKKPSVADYVAESVAKRYDALLTDWQDKNDAADETSDCAKEAERDFMLANARAVIAGIERDRAWDALEYYAEATVSHQAPGDE